MGGFGNCFKSGKLGAHLGNSITSHDSTGHDNSYPKHLLHGLSNNRAVGEDGQFTIFGKVASQH
jgi:hypothetical protein